MRLCTYTSGGSAPRLGVLIDTRHGARIIDLAGARERAGGASLSSHGGAFSDVRELLAAGDHALAEAARVVRSVVDADDITRMEERGFAHAPDLVRFLPPVPRPGKIICVGQNYRAHVAEMKRELPKYPMFFAKFANTLVGHDGEIVLPRQSKQVDYEAELMIVVGRTCKDVPREGAFDVIAGYTIFNDVSVRDYQRRTSQFLQGKTFDTTGPCGPFLVTADEVPEPENLPVRLRLNGETMQDSNTSDFIFDIPTTINYLSEIMTLEPGDLIATGTPGGVGFARDPQVFLRDGDTVEVEIGHLGVLSNKVSAAR